MTSTTARGRRFLRSAAAMYLIGGGWAFGAATADAQAWPSISLTSPIGGFDRPTHITHAGDDSGRLFVSEQAGRIRIVVNGVIATTPFLDITSRVKEALNGIAFPPGYATKGYFYVKYSDTSCNIVVARYRLTADPNVADPGSEEIILREPQAQRGQCGHDGGAPSFSPNDGYLYLSIGDGSGGGDPTDLAQNPGSILGKMLRIDVESGAAPYAIPATNPFIATPGYRPEIWALGLRNPWRFSFTATGDLYIADVGQGRREEVNYQPATSPGGQNYGWKIMEGSACNDPARCQTTSGLTPPVLEYDHSQGCSITGGNVYRGADAALQGIYFYGDWCSGRIWGLRRSGAGWQSALLASTTAAVVSFGEAEDGTLWIADYSGDALYKITGVAPVPADLAITKTASVSSQNDIVYRIDVTNTGSTAATGVVMTDELPAGVTVSSVTPTGWSCQRESRTVTCRVAELSGDEMVTATIVVRPATAATITNTASVTANEPDPDTTNNTATNVTTAKTLAITDFSPSGGPVGASVVITGENFNGITAVAFNGRRARFTVQSATKIVATVPANATSGSLSVTSALGTVSSASAFTVGPRVTGFTPSYGTAGGKVGIRGANFTGVTTVQFDGVSATFIIDSPSSITATVPDAAGLGPISVTTAFGTATSANVFRALPKITSFSPSSGRPGTVVTITGTGFTDVTTVHFNARRADFTVDSGTQITATVPVNATSGRIRVTTAAGAANSPNLFVVGAP